MTQPAGTPSQPAGDAQAAASPLVQQLEEEYRAKVVELESKVARAQLQVRLQLSIAKSIPCRSSPLWV